MKIIKNLNGTTEIIFHKKKNAKNAWKEKKLNQNAILLG